MTQRRAEETAVMARSPFWATATCPFGGGGRRYDLSVWW